MNTERILSPKKGLFYALGGTLAAKTGENIHLVDQKVGDLLTDHGEYIVGNTLNEIGAALIALALLSVINQFYPLNENIHKSIDKGARNNVLVFRRPLFRKDKK